MYRASSIVQDAGPESEKGSLDGVGPPGHWGWWVSRQETPSSPSLFFHFDCVTGGQSGGLWASVVSAESISYTSYDLSSSLPVF